MSEHTSEIRGCDVDPSLSTCSEPVKTQEWLRSHQVKECDTIPGEHKVYIEDWIARETHGWLQTLDSTEWEEIRESCIRPLELDTLSRLQDEVKTEAKKLACGSATTSNEKCDVFHMLRIVRFASNVQGRISKGPLCPAATWIPIYEQLFEMSCIHSWSREEVTSQYNRLWHVCVPSISAEKRGEEVTQMYVDVAICVAIECWDVVRFQLDIEPDQYPSRLLKIPTLIVEFVKHDGSNDYATHKNHLLIALSTASAYLVSLRIDLPVFGLLMDGACVHIIAAWCTYVENDADAPNSRSTGMSYKEILAIDLDKVLDVLLLHSMLCAIATRQKGEILDRFKEVKSQLVEILSSDFCSWNNETVFENVSKVETSPPSISAWQEKCFG